MPYEHPHRRPRLGTSSCLVSALLFLAGCATSAVEQRPPSHLPADLGAPHEEGPRDDAPTTFDGTLASYVAYAMRKSPELQASFERYRASVYRISRARRLPEPTISFGYFLRSIETRVGPQLARVSLAQTFPWPTKLRAASDAASAEAEALARRFDAEALALTRRVSEAYYALWQLRETRTVQREHLEVLLALAESVRARVQTGQASLSEQQQVDLSCARQSDLILGLDERERVQAAALRALLGAPYAAQLPTTEPPDARSLSEPDAALVREALAHPSITSFARRAEAKEHAARSEAADRYPSFSVGLDWVITGEARMPNVQDSGKDAVMIGAGIRVPLFFGSYADAARALQAEARAERAEEQSQKLRALSELDAHSAAVRDAARRAALYRDTLVPQAASAYESVLGAYVSGRGNIAATLLAQRDLLDLRLELLRARTDLAQGWARLDQVLAHEPVATRGNDDDH